LPFRRFERDNFMQSLSRVSLLLASLALLLALPAVAQDEAPSLGDVARQSRLQKQQKEQAGKTASETAPDAHTKSSAPVKEAGNTGADGASAKESKPAKSAQIVPATKKIITNDEIPEHVGPTHTLKTNSAGEEEDGEAPEGEDGKAPADYWKTRIQSQKNSIAALKGEIDSMNSSISFAPANCVSGCVEWNERQRQKQQQVESMKTQLEEQEKQLEEMQEMARKQGYGSSVYDP
jgi:hypothetical protein